MLMRIERVIEHVLAAAMVFLVAMAGANTAGRYFFSRPIAVAEELMSYVLVWGVCLGAALVTLRGEDINMDILLVRLPRAFRRVLHIASLAMLAACAVFVAWQAKDPLAAQLQFGTRSVAAGVPMWLVHGALPLGMLLVGAAATLRLIRALRGRAEETDPERRIVDF